MNRFNNNELTFNHVGFSRYGKKPGQVGFGFHNPSKAGESHQYPMSYILKQLADTSPFSFRAKTTPLDLGTVLNGDCRYPCVLYSTDGFGSEKESPSTRARLFKRWRMYVQKISNGAIYMLESEDGITWGTPEVLADFPATAAKARHGIVVSYDASGLVVYDDSVTVTTYKFATIYRQDDLVAGTAADMVLALSNDGVTWVKTAMANHAVSGDPFGAELAASLGMGSAAIFKQNTALTFEATRPKTFFGAPGWHSYQRYATEEAVNFGDTLFGATLMGQNSTDNTKAKNLGHFANWNRNLLRQVGERSFGQMTKMVPWHIVKYSDIYVALVQLYYHEAGTATLVPSGVAVAVSRDGLIFESAGPLYDAGLTHALNDRSAAVNNTNMKPTTVLYNQGDGDGSGVHAGSIVADRSGFSFGKDCGKDENRSLFRVYWTESDSEKVLVGEF